MDKAVQSKETYDSMFSAGGHEGVYDLPYWRSAYFPLFKSVLREILRRDVRSVLEVGCDSGAFAHLLMTKSNLEYHGFDWSQVGVDKAIARTQRRDAFFEGDATAPAAYRGQDYDCIVCTEVLEHVEEDLKAISHWKAGVFCACSVPNFDSETHVRFFRTSDEVRARYGALIHIEDVIRIKKPVSSDISTASVLRQIRWARYRPRQLMALLGLSTFDSAGGWFLFTGRKR
jgi:SAM-dependent methyltransferase